MTLEIQTHGEVQHVDLDPLAQRYAGVVRIGQMCPRVWNTIAIDDPSVDPFQCQLIGTAGGPWRIANGQNRTECPKGLLSSKQIPCNSCMGRCVNLRPGRPRYFQHDPATSTMLNGVPIAPYGAELHPGDVLTMGDVVVKVV